MPVDHRARLNLHRRLDEVLGADDADALMALLPSSERSGSASNDKGMLLSEDVRSLENRLGARIEGAVATAMERQIRWMVTFNTGLVVVALAAARLLF